MTSKPILVSCVTCGVVFDLRIAKRCSGHGGIDSEGRMTGIRRSDFCFVCPLGHAGHNNNGWRVGERRTATPEEEAIGIEFMLTEYDVNGP